MIVIEAFHSSGHLEDIEINHNLHSDRNTHGNEKNVKSTPNSNFISTTKSDHLTKTLLEQREKEKPIFNIIEEDSVVEVTSDNLSLNNIQTCNSTTETHSAEDRTNNTSSSFKESSNSSRSSLQSFTLHLNTLVGQLYNFSEIPRNVIDEIFNSISSLFTFTLSAIEQDIINLPCDNHGSKLHDIHKIFEKFSNELWSYRTETRRFNKLKECQSFIAPLQLVIGEREEFTEKNGTIIFKHIPVSIEFIQLRHVLKSVFELPEIFNKTINYMDELSHSSGIISNYIQGSLWKEKKLQFGSDTTFPLFIYYDDYEPNNALGIVESLKSVQSTQQSPVCHPNINQNLIIFLSSCFLIL